MSGWRSSGFEYVCSLCLRCPQVHVLFIAVYWWSGRRIFVTFSIHLLQCSNIKHYTVQRSCRYSGVADRFLTKLSCHCITHYSCKTSFFFTLLLQIITIPYITVAFIIAIYMAVVIVFVCIIWSCGCSSFFASLSFSLLFCWFSCLSCHLLVVQIFVSLIVLVSDQR